MSELGGYSSIPLAEQKPVIVRVKRKATHSKLEAFWLEISDRPVKRPLVDFKNLSVSEPPAKAEISDKLPHLDFGNLSFSDSSPNGKPEKRTVFVQHVKTVTNSEATCDILKSLVSSSVGSSEKIVKIGRDRNILKGESKQDQLLSKAKHEQEMVAKNARFKQIWRSRKSKKELMQEEPLRVTCHLYDIERVDVQETTKDVHESSSSDVFFEEYAVLQNYLSLMDEFLPSAAEELRSDMQSYASSKGSKDEYVYDLYTMNADVDMNDSEVIQPYPLVHVDEDDAFYDGPDESDYDSADSNAEDNPLNDYPDEEPSEEEEEEEEDAEAESDDSNVESDEDGSDKSSTQSLKPEDLLFFGNGRAVNVEEDDNILDYDDSIEEDNDYELDEDDLDNH